MNKPTFIVIGAAKSGTTSLHYYLDEHPNITMSSIKEPTYFVYKDIDINELPKNISSGYKKNIVFDYYNYLNLFKIKEETKEIGEISNEYLYASSAAANIKKELPDVKIIAILRNPIERAFSQYCMNVRANREDLSFKDALKIEEKRITDNWEWGYHYKESGLYYKQLKRYFDIFDNNKIKIILYDDWKNNPINVYKEILNFLNLDPTYIPDMSKKYKVSRFIRYEYLYKLLNNRYKKQLKVLIPPKTKLNIKNLIKKINELNSYKPEMNTEDKIYLINFFKDDIQKLEHLLDVDLSHWYKIKHHF